MFGFIERRRERLARREAAQDAERARWAALTPEQKHQEAHSMYASDDWEDRGYFDGR